MGPLGRDYLKNALGKYILVIYIIYMKETYLNANVSCKD
jgi:hypothetical protein